MSEQTARTAVEPGWDDCHSICEPEGDDCVYVGVADDEAGHWLWVSVDCNSAHFTDYLMGSEPDGPYETRLDAVHAGIFAALEWMSNNDYRNAETEEDFRVQVAEILKSEGAQE